MHTRGPIHLLAEDRHQLELFLRTGRGTTSERRRARIALLSADGLPPEEIATTLDVSPRTIARCLQRFARPNRDGHAHNAVVDAPRSGRPREIHRADIIATMCSPRPDGNRVRGWTINRFAREYGGGRPSRRSIYRILTLAAHLCGAERDTCHPLVRVLQDKVRSLGPYDHIVVYRQGQHFFLAYADDGAWRPVLCLSWIGEFRFALLVHRANGRTQLGCDGDGCDRPSDGRWQTLPVVGVMLHVLTEAVNAFGPQLAARTAELVEPAP